MREEVALSSATSAVASASLLARVASACLRETSRRWWRPPNPGQYLPREIGRGNFGRWLGSSPSGLSEGTPEQGGQGRGGWELRL